MDVSENSGTPKSSILIWFSIIWKHPCRNHQKLQIGTTNLAPEGLGFPSDLALQSASQALGAVIGHAAVGGPSKHPATSGGLLV